METLQDRYNIYEADEREIEITIHVIDDIVWNGEASKEAIGTQATLSVFDKEMAGN
jgi:hypothetical protein